MPLQRRIPAQFDDDAWAQDLTRTTSNGRQAATVARAAYEQAGVAINDLRPCQPQGDDGTQLPNCLKVYLPAPNGRFGIVWGARRFPTGLRLIFLAFGVRHQPTPITRTHRLPTCPPAPTRHQRLRPGDHHPSGGHPYAASESCPAGSSGRSSGRPAGRLRMIRRKESLPRPP